MYIITCQSGKHVDELPEIEVTRLQDMETVGWVFATQSNFPWVIGNATYMYLCPDCAAHYKQERDKEIEVIMADAHQVPFYKYLKIRHRLIELAASADMLSNFRSLCDIG